MSMSEVMAVIREFAEAPLLAALHGICFDFRWIPGAAWSDSSSLNERAQRGTGEGWRKFPADAGDDPPRLDDEIVSG